MTDKVTKQGGAKSEEQGTGSKGAKCPTPKPHSQCGCVDATPCGAPPLPLWVYNLRNDKLNINGFQSKPSAVPCALTQLPGQLDAANRRRRCRIGAIGACVPRNSKSTLCAPFHANTPGLVFTTPMHSTQHSTQHNTHSTHHTTHNTAHNTPQTAHSTPHSTTHSTASAAQHGKRSTQRHSQCTAHGATHSAQHNTQHMTQHTVLLHSTQHTAQHSTQHSTQHEAQHMTQHSTQHSVMTQCHNTVS